VEISPHAIRVCLDLGFLVTYYASYGMQSDGVPNQLQAVLVLLIILPLSGECTVRLTVAGLGRCKLVGNDEAKEERSDGVIVRIVSGDGASKGQTGRDRLCIRYYDTSEHTRARTRQT